MSDFYPQSNPRSEPPSRPHYEDSSESAGIWKSLAGIAGIMVVAGAIVGGAVWFMQSNQSPANPDAWDDRVEEYVRVVEQSRGLSFENPVWVEFLSEEEFRETVTEDEEHLSEEDQEFYDYYAGLLRSYGLLEGDVDLFEQNNQLYGDSVTGFYSDDSKTLTIRGDEITTDVKLTIVHELTHALQDQHFDLSTINDLEGQALLARRALIEGDARAVEVDYLRSLSDEEQNAYFDSFLDSEDDDDGTDDDGTDDGGDDDGGDVPSALSAPLQSSYDLGNGFISALRYEGGWARVNAAYDDPPTSMDHLLYPWRYLDGDDIETVEAPEVDDPDASAPEELGALDWYFILARVIDPAEALIVADGWGGDISIDFTEDSATCFVDNLTGDSAASTDSFEAAVNKWVAAAPDYRSVTRDGDLLTVKGCDPGTDASAAGADNSDEALQLPVIRVQVVNSWLEDGAPDEAARCAGDFVASEIPLELLIAPEFTAAQQTVFDELIAGLSEACN
jgi:Putative metallopeptidase family (DUF6782)